MYIFKRPYRHLFPPTASLLYSSHGKLKVTQRTVSEFSPSQRLILRLES
jgi:hypothetical protein